MRNNGTQAQDDFEDHWKKKPGSHAWRMRDKKDINGLNGKKIGKPGGIAAFAQPSDFLVTDEGVLFFAEVKSTSDPKRFNYNQIEPAQRSAASISAACGSPYFFFIYSIARAQWFILTAAQFVADMKAGKSSRTFEELTPCDIQ